MVASTITCWHNFTIHYLVLYNMAQSGTILWSYYFTLFQKKCKNNCLHYNLPVQFHLIWHTMKALNSPPYPGRKFDFPQKIGKTWWLWWCSMLFGVCCPPPLWGPSHSSGKSLLVVPSSVPKCSTKYCNPHSANFIGFAFVASPNTHTNTNAV